MKDFPLSYSIHFLYQPSRISCRDREWRINEQNLHKVTDLQRC